MDIKMNVINQKKIEKFNLCLKQMWSLLNADPKLLDSVQFEGPEYVFPSRYDVTAFASACVGAASLAVAELKLVRTQKTNNYQQPNILVNSIHASAAFKADALFKPIGWNIPSPWDPFSGDYLCSDRWIRLHTNYSYHREAVFKVLGRFNQPEDLAKEVAKRKASELENEIFEAGGCSAVMYDRSTWSQHEHGKHTMDQAIVQADYIRNANRLFSSIFLDAKPLHGIRVLDLTRVIAGPTCTKFLSAYGANVLRIDPPNFSEVEALLPETTVGKRRAFLDLKSIEGRKIFEKLLQQSHVLVHGLRPDALEKMGMDSYFFEKLNPSLIVINLNAYGNKGPWKNRRGFDSLVQMSSGIADAGARYKNSVKPIPLPMQALDYGTGYLMAAAVCRALSDLYTKNQVSAITASLIGASNFLQNLNGNFEIDSPKNSDFDSFLIHDDTAFGPGMRLANPATINGERATWGIQAGSLGVDQPVFE